MKKHIIWALFITTVGLWLGYVISNVAAFEYLSNYLSTATSFLASLIILIAFDHKGPLKLNWLFLVGICASWALGDFIWLIQYNFLGLDPEASVLLLYIYAIPNVLILTSIFIYFYRNLKRWHQFQLVADLVVTSIIVILLLRYSYGRVFFSMQLPIHENISTLMYIFTDALTLIIITVLLSSARNQKIANSMKIIVIATLTFILTDLAYVYTYVADIYMPNRIIDSLYVLSFVLYAYSAVVEMKSPSIAIKPTVERRIYNHGLSYRIPFFILPTIALYNRGIVALEGLINITVVALLYVWMSSFIQKSIASEVMLASEKISNEKLEALVEKRTEALQKSNEALTQLTITDSLTALYNRRHFLNHVEALIENHNQAFSVLYIDLNHFKIVNDMYGHTYGDQVLAQIASRLGSAHKGLFIARLGGDEFAIINPHTTPNWMVKEQELIQKIFAIFDQKIIVDEYAFEIGCSIGIAKYPEDGRDYVTLIKHADYAMYESKRSNLSKAYTYYTASHGEAIERRNQISALLKTVDYNHEFCLHYQPQFTLGGKTIIGVEALSRWQNPYLGNVSPSEFISVAEDNGCIVALGRWVIDTAFSQFRAWLDLGYDLPKMSINLSPLQLDSLDFLTYIKGKLDFYNLKPENIEFEITENHAMHVATIIEEIFTTLSGMGFQISIDDFGTGYSSLSYINRFDVDRIKIAKELVDNIVESNESQHIIKAIIVMARGMNLSTIAEGVENKAQLAILDALGCDAIQGYLYSKPLTSKALVETYFTNVER